MGVRGLQTYVENYCSNSFCILSIAELAERHRNYTDQELIIIVDGINCIKYMYGDLSWIGGAQLKEYAETVKKFVESFRDIGIHLVFFFNGPTVIRERQTWVERRQTWVERRKVDLDKVENILDQICSGNSSNSIPFRDNFILPPGIYHQTKFLLENMCNCEVYLSVLECDEEIAQYARSKNVFGVLGHDSDYLIFDIGQAFYFDRQYLELETMRTRVYNPEMLAQSLELNKSQLPLLATLMGNDFINYEDLENFHKKLTSGKGRYVKYLVPHIAKYIRSFPANLSHREVLKGMAKHVFGNPNRYKDVETSVVSYLKTPEEVGFQNSENVKTTDHGSQRNSERGRQGEREEILGFHSGSSRRKDGISRRCEEIRTSYRQETSGNWREDNKRKHEDKAWLELVKDVEQLYRNNKLPDQIYPIIKGLPVAIGTSFEDYRIEPRDLPIFAELSQELRQRLYGILLQQKPIRAGSHEVEEWCMAGRRSLDRGPSYNAALAPAIIHPGLLVLWGKLDRPLGHLNDVRWTLFVNSVSPRLDVNLVQMLPPHLVMPTLILYHIVNYNGSGQLEEWEVDAVLATAAILHHYGPEELSAIAPDPMTSRGIRVSCLVMRLSCYVFNNLLAACGCPLSIEQTAPWNFFDGKLFQLKYREAKQSGVSHAQLCDNWDDSLEAFRQARSVIIDDSGI